MAIDTERKRKSAAWISGTIPPTLVPDGSFSQADRQTIAWGYYGILASAPFVATITADAIGINFYVERTRNKNMYVSRTRSINLER